MTKILALAVAVLVVVVVLSPLCKCKQVILNESTLINTCTKTCTKIPTLHNKHGCVKLDRCKLNSKGWTRGFVRCDYCECSCQQNVPDKDVLVSKTKLSTTEPALFGTCKRTCNKRGIARTNFKGCQEVRDCYRERKGWTRWFVRCDYCTCTCINKKHAAKYTLTNMRYDLSDAAVKQGAPIAMTDTNVVNRGKGSQTVSRQLKFGFLKRVTVTSSHSMEVGLTVTVTAGVTIGKATIGSSVERSLKYGYTYTAGEFKQESKHDSLTANIAVPGRSSVKALAVGHKMKIDVPYTATLVTTYEDGSKSSKAISGVYTDVDFAKFEVQYERAKPL